MLILKLLLERHHYILPLKTIMGDIVILLLIYEAKPNETDAFGKTPLMFAADFKLINICRLLMLKIPRIILNTMKIYLCAVAGNNKELFELLTGYEPIPLLSATLPQNQTSLHQRQFLKQKNRLLTPRLP